MPLDGHGYLTSYGWSGKGTGLRTGAIDRPLAIPKKRNLAGVGKDRDEAFPFWDHLYSAATKAITIKIADDDDDEVDDDQNEDSSASTTLELKRTTTGIISNRRPLSGTPASGISTPDSDTYSRTSVITIAKREAAKKGLYSRFFRGPILGPDDPINLSSPPAPSPLHCPYPTSEREIAPQTDAPNRKEGTKRKLSELLETRDQRRERKRLKREKKEKRAAKRAAKAKKEKPVLHNLEKKDRARKEAKRTMKQLKANSLDTAERQKPPVDVVFTSIDQPGSQGHCERSVYTSPQVDDSATKDNIDPKKRKKKREKKDP
jgi:nucleolar protein TMA23